MNVLQQEAGKSAMDTSEPAPQKEKRKPAEQLEPEGEGHKGDLGLKPLGKVNPVTPPGAPPSSDSEAKAAEVSTLGTYGSASGGGGSAERVGPYEPKMH